MKQIITRDMFPKIKPPKFKVAGKYIFNEYELRCLMLEIAKGNIQSGISVIDMESKQKAFIQEDGSLSRYVGEGLKINGKIGLELIKSKASRLNELAKILDIKTLELYKILNKKNAVKLDSLEIITKYALATMEIKNQKRKI